MVHASAANAYNAFDESHPYFSAESHNVRLGLCTDGFAPFIQFSKQYYCYPVILTLYNLSPWMCMKKQYMFPICIIPGPQNLKKKLDVYLQTFD